MYIKDARHRARKGTMNTVTHQVSGHEATSLPAAQEDFVDTNIAARLGMWEEPPVRILLLYGSLRARSYSRFLVEEAASLLLRFGAEVRIFDPRGLPLVDEVEGNSHPKVKELLELSLWSEGQVWCSPERHGTITGVIKTQIDHLPLSAGGVRPTQGRTLAVMQVSGGSQSFNSVNQLRQLGRWMRMFTIPNQSSVAKAYEEFDEAGRMKPSSYYDRLVDVMEELVKFTLLLRGKADYLVDRYSERVEESRALDPVRELAERVLRDQKAAALRTPAE
jgi:arsenic resistance protein ArsH